MNKYFTTYATIIFCVIHATALSNGSSRLKSLHKATDVFTPQQWTAAKVTTGLAATAAISYAADKYIGKGNGKNFYNGQYAWGYAQAFKLSSVCLSIAPMLNETWGDQFFRFGTRAPIVGLAGIGIAHPTTQKLAAHAPFIGDHISTYTKEGESKCGSDCQGICNRCFIPKTLLVVGLYKVIDPLVDQIGTAVGKKFGFIHEDEE